MAAGGTFFNRRLSAGRAARTGHFNSAHYREFCVTGIGPIERAMGDLAGFLHGIRGELIPYELTVP